MAEATTSDLAQNTAPMQPRDKLQEDLEVRLKMYNQGSKLWSAAYHTLLYSSATLSTAAAMLVKMTSFKDHAQDISAVLAAVSALFSTYIAGGGFSRKWRANRIARGKISQLLIDISDPSCDLAQLRLQLKQVIQEEDEGIVGPG
jgi:hypothetical protein